MKTRITAVSSFSKGVSTDKLLAVITTLYDLYNWMLGEKIMNLVLSSFRFSRLLFVQILISVIQVTVEDEISTPVNLRGMKQ